MRLNTKKYKIKTIVERWTEQYPEDKPDITMNLIKSNPQTEDEITKIIGNSSWTFNRCDECDQDCDNTVMLGEEPDYESSTVFICVDCLQKAIDLINRGKSKDDGRDNNI